MRPILIGLTYKRVIQNQQLGKSLASISEAVTVRLETRMKPANYFVLPVVVLGFLVSTNAQQNSTQVTVSSVVTCVSTSDQRQHCPANTSAGIVMGYGLLHFDITSTIAQRDLEIKQTLNGPIFGFGIYF